MKVNFVDSERVISKKTGRSGGNAYGYSTGANLLKRSLLMNEVEFDTKAKICIQYAAPHFFEPVEGCVNVLFSMWEAEDLPKDLIEPYEKADFLIVPSRNSRDCFRKANIMAPLYICRQGIDTDFYEYRVHSYLYPLKKRIRFLWVGAPNVRKGYAIATKAFYEAFHNSDADVELYIKSSLFKREGRLEALPQFETMIDTRNLTLEGMRDLYYSAHVFLFPSMGEGCGLPALEAMSTGLPVIAPPWSGMKDYMLKEHSFPVTYQKVDVDYGTETKMIEADLDDLVKKMLFVRANLPRAMSRGMKASVFVGENFSLETMGNRMMEILEDIEEKIK